MPQKRTVLVRYRQFEDAVDAINGTTLEGAVRDALNFREDGVKIGERWAKRIRRDPDDDRERMAANHVRDGRAYIFGNLIAYTMGRDQAILDENPNAREADIEQLRAPARKQFIDSMLFWMVTANHVFLVQQGRLRPDELETYLRWLLVERTPTCGNDLQVILNPDLHLRAGIRQEDVKAIKIGGQVHAHPVAAAEGATEPHRERRRFGRAGRELARQVLDLVVGDDGAAVERILREVPDGVDLAVDVEISFDTTKRKYSRDAMRRIAMATRNLPDADIQLKTASGSISGNEIRLSHPINVPTVGSLFDRDAVLNGMIEAYGKFVKAGRIEPSDIDLPDDE